MSKIRNLALIAGFVSLAAVGFPQHISGQRSAVEIWSANCGRCHTLQPPNRYYAKDWASIGIHMAVTARLTGSEADAVTRFLISGARSGEEGAPGTVATTVLPAGMVLTTSSQETVINPEEVYTQQCAPCHGKEGHGDGPAAVAFNPRPGDFEDTGFWAQHTDQQIDSVLMTGKGSMPGTGDRIAPEVRAALIKYLREKYGDGSAKKAAAWISRR